MSTGKSVLVACALVVLTAGTAFASEGELRWGDFGWRVLNIVIFLAILWKFSGKLITNYLSGRREGIRKELDDLDVRREQAKQHLADIEKSIANLDAERKAILDQSVVQAEAARKAILQEAQRQADQLLEQARRTAENEARSVMADVRAVIADEIVDAAEKTLRSKLNASAHGKLIENSLNKVVLN